MTVSHTASLRGTMGPKRGHFLLKEAVNEADHPSKGVAVGEEGAASSEIRKIRALESVLTTDSGTSQPKTLKIGKVKHKPTLCSGESILKHINI